ncbi:MAG: DUF3137 domain-containing protein [Pseudomonadota bacterium]|nr:DUF3137 domain-containing protein [Pseudomonadota bacterium]
MSNPPSPNFTELTSKGSGEGGVVSIEGTELVSRAPTQKTNITRLIDRIEQQRLAYLKQHNRRIILGLIFALIAGVYLTLFSGLNESVLMQTLGGGFLFIGAFAYLPVHSYRKAFKAEFMPELVRLLGDFSYMPKRPLNEKALKRSGLIPPRYALHMEDFIGGNIDNSKVEFAETVVSNPARAKPKHVKDKRVKGLPVTRGMSMIIVRPTKFTGHTIMTSKRGTKLEKEAQIKQGLSGVKLPATGNVSWLDIYTTQQTEATNLAHPETLSLIQKISLNLFNAPIEVSFYENYVAFLMPYSNNLFEPRAITKPAFSNEDIPILEKHVMLTRTFVEHLDKIS